MIKKKLLFEKDLTEKFSSGLEKISKAVRSTLGPAGNCVIIERLDKFPHITKDGVTVARSIKLEDPFEDLAAQTIIEIAEQTNQVAGDGTTTAVVLAEAIFKEGHRYIELGQNTVVNLTYMISEAVQDVIAQLEKHNKTVENFDEIQSIATISANGDKEIGAVIAEAFDIVGKDGLITVEEGSGFKTELRQTQGFRIEKGFQSPLLVNDKVKNEFIVNDCKVLIYDGEISSMEQFYPIIKQIVDQNNAQPVLVLCHELKGDPKAFLILNVTKGSVKICAVKAPKFGPERTGVLQDLAIWSGGRLINPKAGDTLKECSLDDLGSVGQVVVRKDETIFVDGKGTVEAIEAQSNLLQEHLKQQEHQWDKDNLRERVSQLTGGAAVISIGASTDIEMKEKKDRIEDALNSTRAAIEEGILPGGGVALLRIAHAMEEKSSGHTILKNAIISPFVQIIKNIGKSDQVVMKEILAKKKFAYGYDARIDKYGDLYELGVIDPVKVTKSALLHAVSIASLLLTCSTGIVSVFDESTTTEQEF